MYGLTGCCMNIIPKWFAHCTLLKCRTLREPQSTAQKNGQLSIHSGFIGILEIFLLCSVLLMSNTLTAQHFLNDAQGTIINTATGVIRLRSANSEVRNTQASINKIQNFGVLECTGVKNTFTGSVASVVWGNNHQWRIGGLVRFIPYPEQPADTQIIPPQYYTNLECAGSSIKRLTDGIHIGGDAEAAVPPNGSGVFRSSGGRRLYEGTIYFDNSAAQNIPGNESYNAIEIQRANRTDAVKRIGSGVVVSVATTFRQSSDLQTANSAGLQVFGTLRIGKKGYFPAMPTTNGGDVLIAGGGQIIGGSDSTVFGVSSVRIVSGSLLATVPGSTIVINTGCTIRTDENLALSTFGTLALLPQTTLWVHGGLRNDVNSKNNYVFHTNSTVVFDAHIPQTLPATIMSHPYGNFIVKNSEKSPDSGGAGVGIIIAGNCMVSAAMINLTSVPEASLTMLNPRASVLFGNTTEEIRGLMIRYLSVAADSVVFNNAHTWFRRSAGEMPLTMSLDNRGATIPLRYQPITDVRRKIDWSWTGSTNWQGVIQIAYNREDIKEPFEPSLETRLSLFEQYATNSRLLGGLGFRRQVIGNGVWGFVRLGGLHASDGNQTPSPIQVVSGHSLLVRADLLPVVSVSDGRWSNPFTWSTGREPDEHDSVSIFHNVHIGFRRLGIDGNRAEGQIREQSARFNEPRPLARAVYIATPPTPHHQGALLLTSLVGAEAAFEDEKPPVSEVWQITSEKLRIQSGTTITESEEIFRGVFMQRSAGARYNTKNTYQGLLIIQTASTDKTVVRVGSLINDGILLNGGILEIR